MARTPHQEYVAALAAYTAAKERLIEAKRHYNHKAAPEAVAERRAKQAEYRAKRRAAWNAPEAKAQRVRDEEERAAQQRVWLKGYYLRHGINVD